MSAELRREITSKLPAGQLDLVCQNAPEGTDANGVSYKDLCSACLVDTSTDNQKACVAGVVADFVEARQGRAAPKEDVQLNAACTDPNDPACYQ